MTPIYQLIFEIERAIEISRKNMITKYDYDFMMAIQTEVID